MTMNRRKGLHDGPNWSEPEPIKPKTLVGAVLAAVFVSTCVLAAQRGVDVPRTPRIVTVDAYVSLLDPFETKSAPVSSRLDDMGTSCSGVEADFCTAHCISVQASRGMGSYPLVQVTCEEAGVGLVHCGCSWAVPGPYHPSQPFWPLGSLF